MWGSKDNYGPRQGLDCAGGPSSRSRLGDRGVGSGRGRGQDGGAATEGQAHLDS